MKDVSPQVAVGLLKVPISNTLVNINNIREASKKRCLLNGGKALAVKKKRAFFGMFFFIS